MIYIQHTTKADHDMAQPIASEDNADFYSFTIKALPNSDQKEILNFRNSSDQLDARMPMHGSRMLARDMVRLASTLPLVWKRRLSYQSTCHCRSSVFHSSIGRGFADVLSAQAFSQQSYKQVFVARMT